MVKYALGHCYLGCILAAHSQAGLLAVYLGDQPNALIHALQHRIPTAQLLPADQSTASILARLIAFAENPALPIEIPLHLQGTEFQIRVWQALRAIPLGQTITYTQLAHSIGAPAAVRAVGRACALNQLALIIPCHRVIAANGSLTGYRWGIERKQAILNHEAALAI